MQHRTSKRRRRSKLKNIGADVNTEDGMISKSRLRVDRHLPSSNQQRTTYRCQYTIDLVVYLDARVFRSSRLVSFHCILSSTVCSFFMFLLIVCCALTVDRDRQSQWNVNATKYMASSQLPAHTSSRRHRILNKSNFGLLSFTFHMQWIYIHGHCVYYLLLPLFRSDWHFSLLS